MEGGLNLGALANIGRAVGTAASKAAAAAARGTSAAASRAAAAVRAAPGQAIRGIRNLPGWVRANPISALGVGLSVGAPVYDAISTRQRELQNEAADRAAAELQAKYEAKAAKDEADYLIEKGINDKKNQDALDAANDAIDRQNAAVTALENEILRQKASYDAWLAAQEGASEEAIRNILNGGNPPGTNNPGGTNNPPPTTNPPYVPPTTNPPYVPPTTTPPYVPPTTNPPPVTPPPVVPPTTNPGGRGNRRGGAKNEKAILKMLNGGCRALPTRYVGDPSLDIYRGQEPTTKPTWKLDEFQPIIDYAEGYGPGGRTHPDDHYDSSGRYVGPPRPLPPYVHEGPGGILGSYYSGERVSDPRNYGAPGTFSTTTYSGQSREEEMRRREAEAAAARMLEAARRKAEADALAAKIAATQPGLGRRQPVRVSAVAPRPGPVRPVTIADRFRTRRGGGKGEKAILKMLNAM